MPEQNNLKRFVQKRVALLGHNCLPRTMTAAGHASDTALVEIERRRGSEGWRQAGDRKALYVQGRTEECGDLAPAPRSS